jgi:hypothetical protein
MVVLNQLGAFLTWPGKRGSADSECGVLNLTGSAEVLPKRKLYRVGPNCGPSLTL